MSPLTIDAQLLTRAQGLTLATKFTIARILMVPVFVTCLLYYDPVARDAVRWWALGVFLAGAITDGIDGYLARMRGQRSALGALLDPLADKLLLTSSFLTLGLAANWPAASRIPAWITVTVVSRDALLIIGSLVMYLMTSRLTIQPSRWGKVTTVAQMATIVAVLVQWPRGVLQLFWWWAACATLVSAAGYLRTGSRRLGLALMSEPASVAEEPVSVSTVQDE